MNLYQLKLLVNKLFLQNNYHLKMNDGNFVTTHLNSFNTTSKLTSLY
jgi:hypothetical protein